MKWFFALKCSTDPLSDYINLLKVSVHTALKNTDLEPWCIYDGSPDELTQWLEERGVKMVYHRSFLYPHLERIGRNINPNFLDIGGGAFLRIEIPFIAQQLGLTDQYVLYTDCDVMFMQNVVSELANLKPAYFSVGPEENKTNYVNMNTGVMVMNLESLRKKDKGFRRYIVKNIDRLIYQAWDQGAYQQYFKTLLFRRPKWDKLPAEFNWKPYWGDTESARIIHFHGPKPRHLPIITNQNTPEYLLPLKPMVNPAFEECCKVWEAQLAELSSQN